MTELMRYTVQRVPEVTTNTQAAQMCVCDNLQCDFWQHLPHVQE